jgi:hypothetical protein
MKDMFSKVCDINKFVGSMWSQDYVFFIRNLTSQW